MRALGASERVMAIINSAEAPPAIAPSDNKDQDSATRDSAANLEIAGGSTLGDTVAGRVVFKARHNWHPPLA